MSTSRPLGTCRAAGLLLGLALLAGLLPAQAQIPTTVLPSDVAGRIETKAGTMFTVGNMRTEVVPFDDPGYANQGRFQWIMISADSLQHGEMLFRNLVLKAFDVTLNLERLYGPLMDTRNERSARTMMWAVVDEEAMNKALNADTDWAAESPLKDLACTFLEGQVKFTAKLKPLANSDVELIGNLVPREKRYVDFQLTSAKVNKMPFPVPPLKGYLKKFNPLIDMHNMPLSPDVELITVTKGYILVQG